MTPGSEAALEQAVAAVGPVSVAVDASSFHFHFYKSGTVSLVRAWMGKLRQGCLLWGWAAEPLRNPGVSPGE